MAAEIICKFLLRFMQPRFFLGRYIFNMRLREYSKEGGCMKKLVIGLLLSSMLILTGCPDKKDSGGDENKVNVMKTDVKAARVFMSNYLRAVMKRNNGAMYSFYGPKLRDKIKNTPSARNPHPVGYSLNEGENKEKKAEFKVHIFSAITNMPYFSDDEFKYTVSMESGKMIIDDMEKGKSVELYEKNSTLYKREGDKLAGKPLASLSDLPRYAVPKESASLEQKFPVPRKSFGSLALSPDGDTAIITSYDKDSFIGSVNEEESKSSMRSIAVMSQPGGGQKGGGSQGGQGGGQEQKNEKIKLRTVDFYFNSRINNITYSPDGKTFVVEYTPKSGLRQISAYDGKSGEPVQLKSNRSFRSDRFSITDAYFTSPSELIFTIIPVPDATLEEKRFKGDWVLNMEKNELRQIE